LNSQDSSGLNNLTSSTAAATRFFCIFGRGSATRTTLTALVAFKLDCLLDAPRGFFEIEGDLATNIAAASLTTATSTASATSAAAVEQIAEHGKDIAEVTELRTASALQSSVTKLVVAMTFVFIAEHFVGFGRFLEFIGRRFVALVAVGVKFDGYFAIRSVDLLFGRRSFDSEHFVVIAFIRHRTPNHLDDQFRRVPRLALPIAAGQRSITDS
jgi:hypothetical protein